MLTDKHTCTSIIQHLPTPRSAAAFSTAVHMSSFKMRALADILITTHRWTTAPRASPAAAAAAAAGRAGHSIPPSVLIIPKVDITAKLFVLYLEVLSQDAETGLDAALTSDLSATKGAAHHYLVTGCWPSIKQQLSEPTTHITAV